MTKKTTKKTTKTKKTHEAFGPIRFVHFASFKLPGDMLFPLADALRMGFIPSNESASNNVHRSLSGEALVPYDVVLCAFSTTDRSPFIAQPLNRTFDHRIEITPESDSSQKYAARYRHLLKVTIRRHDVFPIDMLRYDAALPATSRDVEIIADSQRPRDVERTVYLYKLAKTVTQRPAADRWKSFGVVVEPVAVGDFHKHVASCAKL